MTKVRDIHGETFGDLRVVEPTRYRALNGNVMWRCVCACGEDRIVATYDLISGRASRCRPCSQRRMRHR